MDGVSEVVLDYQGLVIQKAEVQGADGNYTTLNYDTYDDVNVGSAIRMYLTDSKTF